MKQYLELCKDVLENGNVRDDRTGTGTIGVFGRQLRFDLEKSFPVLTTKRVYWKGVVAELLWFLNGDTNIKYLVDNNVHIWDAWADENGELGRIYSAQWRGFRGYTDTDGEIEVFEVDQITNLIEQIKKNPNSRRHLVVAYNPADADKCGLPACHSFFQFYVNGDELSCQFYMRSNDVFLGLPFNIASYGLLTHMVARATGLKAKELIYSVGDCHLYKNHLEQVKTQLERTPTELPTLKINTDNTDIFSYKIEDFVLENYNPQAAIKAEVSV